MAQALFNGQRMERSQNLVSKPTSQPHSGRDMVYVGESSLKVRLEREGGAFTNRGVVWPRTWCRPPLLSCQGSAVAVVINFLSRVQLFVIPWAAPRQASLSFTISWSLLKLSSTESVMPSTISSSVVPSPPALSLSQHRGLFQLQLLSRRLSPVLVPVGVAFH